MCSTQCTSSCQHISLSGVRTAQRVQQGHACGLGTAGASVSAVHAQHRAAPNAAATHTSVQLGICPELVAAGELHFCQRFSGNGLQVVYCVHAAVKGNVCYTYAYAINNLHKGYHVLMFIAYVYHTLPLTAYVYCICMHAAVKGYHEYQRGAITVRALPSQFCAVVLQHGTLRMSLTACACRSQTRWHTCTWLRCLAKHTVI
jgi:hypothetical protein